MTKLKLGAILDNKPIKLSVDVPTSVHRDLLMYAKILGSETNQAITPEKLIPHMRTRFMSTDRGFAKARKILKERGRKEADLT